MLRKIEVKQFTEPTEIANVRNCKTMVTVFHGSPFRLWHSTVRLNGHLTRKQAILKAIPRLQEECALDNALCREIFNYANRRKSAKLASDC